MITIEKDQDYQPYFREYIRIKGLKPGDKVQGHHYVSWISRKWDEFLLMKGRKHTINKDFAEFEAWLMSLEPEGEEKR